MLGNQSLRTMEAQCGASKFGTCGANNRRLFALSAAVKTGLLKEETSPKGPAFSLQALEPMQVTETAVLLASKLYRGFESCSLRHTV